MFGTKILYEGKSKHNGKLSVVKTLGMGVYIQANGLTQSGGIVESIWKKTLNQIDFSKIKSVLILGLGGGTVAKLIAKKDSNIKLTAVEIDPLMISLGKKYLGLGDLNIDIHKGDAGYLLEKIISKKHKYGLVIVDTYCGDNFPKQFEEELFLRKVKRLLNKEGMIIFNRLYYGEKRPLAVKFGKKLEKIYKEVSWFYPEANLMFIVSTSSLSTKAVGY